MTIDAEGLRFVFHDVAREEAFFFCGIVVGGVVVWASICFAFVFSRPK